MKLIVGLGNPGQQYASTRHNVGFMVISALADRLGAKFKLQSKFEAEVAQTDSLLLAKPQTFMNLSGESVQKLMHFYKLAPEDIWVIHDDVDVPFGKLRIRLDGMTGQQGVRSIIKHIGPDFVRVRMGISLNDRAKESSEHYVLHPFSPSERETLPRVTSRAADIVYSKLAEPVLTETTYEL